MQYGAAQQCVAADEAGASDGASQLNAVLGGPGKGTRLRQRLTCLLVVMISYTPGSAADDQTGDQMAVVEAAIRWGLKGSGVATAERVYLSVNGAAPSAALLARLGGDPRLLSFGDCPHTLWYGTPRCRPPKGTALLSVWDVRVVSKRTATARVQGVSGVACMEYFTRVKGGWRRRPSKDNEVRECGVA